VQSPKKRWLSRRKFLGLAGLTAFGGGAASLGYAWGIEPHWVGIVRLDLPIARLPAALQGRTFVQISDLHIGPVVDDEYITRAIVQACSLNPDILVITATS
jgi:predicted MPP superfamily phosphohydrolase